MLLRLSRLSLCLAAAAVGVGVFAPPELRASCIDIALALCLASLVLWRGAAALERRLAAPAVAGAAVVAAALDAAALEEVETLVARGAAEASSFDLALLRVGEVLRGELGAQKLRISRVDAVGRTAGLSELIGTEPPLWAPRREIALDVAIAGARALRERRPCIELPFALALPVVCEEAPVALLELDRFELEINRAALMRLLAVAGRALAARSPCSAAPAPSRQEAPASIVAQHAMTAASSRPLRRIAAESLCSC